MVDGPRIAVILPSFNQAAFLPRALESLRAQRFTTWEAIVVDDGSPDATREVVAPFLTDRRLRYRRLDRNQGLGRALNIGLDATAAPLVAYLPSDDRYFVDHLASLVDLLTRHPEAPLAFSGVRHRYNRDAAGTPPDEPLQLVQVLHRRGPDRWLERAALTTDDLDRMLWDRLRERGPFVGSGEITCEWVDHPAQRHKLIREGDRSGLNPYRVYHRVAEPLRFQSSIGAFHDEVTLYRRFRDRPPTPRAADGLRILLVGELAYNPERVLALEERGHTLYGLWTPTPSGFNTVGPVPFGHVRDLPRDGWREAVRQLQPDLIYGLLNWQAIPWVNHVLAENAADPHLCVPFVWHFKEGPFIALEKGTWPLLADLHRRADGLAYTSPELRDWFETAVPGAPSRPTLVLDGDLPKREWFDGETAARLSREGDAIHTVVPGRPIGLHPETVAELATQNIHLHVYGDFIHHLWREWAERTHRLAPGFLHVHPQVDQSRWVTELSGYDAGWLHTFTSRNEGDLRRADWDDLNIPARMGTYAAAGLPVIQRANSGAIVATQRLARELEIGLFIDEIADLGPLLRDEAHMAHLRANVWRHRDRFTFDHHADRLIAFFRAVIASRPRISGGSLKTGAA